MAGQINFVNNIAFPVQQFVADKAFVHQLDIVYLKSLDKVFLHETSQKLVEHLPA